MIAAVEVVAKLGDSIIEIARIERRQTYSSPLVVFPLVCGEPSGFVVHRPIGVVGWRNGAPLDDIKVRIAAGDSIVLALGRVTLYVLPIIERTPSVPKKRIDVRPYLYGAIVLVAHLFVWGLAEATTTPPIEKVAKPPPIVRRVHVAHVEVVPPPRPTPPPVSEPAKVAGPEGAKGRAHRSARASTGESALIGAFGDVSSLIPSVDVVKLVNESIAYDEQAAEDQKWGGSSGHFDPFRDCKVNCGTIASGPYETLSFRDRPRPIPQVAVASDDGAVKTAVQLARAQLAACHVQRALDGDTGAVEVELEAGRDGTFTVLYSRGLDTVGPCVGAVIDALKIKKTGDAHASVTVAFTLR